MREVAGRHGNKCGSDFRTVPALYMFPLGSEIIDALKRSVVIYYPAALQLTVSSEDIHPPLNRRKTESILLSPTLTDSLVFYTLSELIRGPHAGLRT